MPEYLDKRALLEWLEQEMADKNWPLQIFLGFAKVKRAIQSGVFNAPEHPVVQAIRDFGPVTAEDRPGYESLIAWLESTTPFVLNPEEGEDDEKN